MASFNSVDSGEKLQLWLLACGVLQDSILFLLNVYMKMLDEIIPQFGDRHHQ